MSEILLLSDIGAFIFLVTISIAIYVLFTAPVRKEKEHNELEIDYTRAERNALARVMTNLRISQEDVDLREEVTKGQRFRDYIEEEMIEQTFPEKYQRDFIDDDEEPIDEEVEKVKKPVGRPKKE